MPSCLVAPSSDMLDKVRHMSGESYLGELEQLVMLAVMRLTDGAYGVTVRDAIEAETGRDLSFGSVYKTLNRLEAKGCISSRVGEPTAERGGRRKRLYRPEAAGIAAVRRSLDALRRLADGLETERSP